MNRPAESGVGAAPRPAAITDQHHQGLVEVQAQAAYGIAGLENSSVLDQHHRVRAAHPQAGRHRHGFAFATHRDQVE